MGLATQSPPSPLSFRSARGLPKWEFIATKKNHKPFGKFIARFAIGQFQQICHKFHIVFERQPCSRHLPFFRIFCSDVDVFVVILMAKLFATVDFCAVRYRSRALFIARRIRASTVCFPDFWHLWLPRMKPPISQRFRFPNFNFLLFGKH